MPRGPSNRPLLLCAMRGSIGDLANISSVFGCSRGILRAGGDDMTKLGIGILLGTLAGVGVAYAARKKGKEMLDKVKQAFEM